MGSASPTLDACRQHARGLGGDERQQLIRELIDGLGDGARAELSVWLSQRLKDR
jgi:hypothetical protein